MSMGNRILLLIGSAKLTRSTSESLGTYLIEKLTEKGMEAETLFIHKSLKTDERRDAFLEAVNRADVVVLAFPLYVDSLPYPVIRGLELIAKNRKGGGKRQRLFCIVNSGFPEASQNDTAIAICRKFASETGFNWTGGLALGAGEVISGKPLREVKGLARNVIKSLNLTAAAIAGDNAVPEEAITLMAKSLIPRWLYLMAGGRSWKKKAATFGVQNKLHARPYVH